MVFGLLAIGVVFYVCPAPGVYNSGFDWYPRAIGVSDMRDIVMKLYSNESFKITLLLILYLLYALLVCAHIVRKYSGSLRNFN
jgi:ABC-type polysaccharide/polyol phosphate export permease